MDDIRASFALRRLFSGRRMKSQKKMPMASIGNINDSNPPPGWPPPAGVGVPVAVDVAPPVGGAGGGGALPLSASATITLYFRFRFFVAFVQITRPARHELLCKNGQTPVPYGLSYSAHQVEIEGQIVKADQDSRVQFTGKQ